MQPEPPPDDDDSRELLDKVDALLKRHQPKRYAEMAAPEQTESSELADVPVLQALHDPLEPTESQMEPEQPKPPRQQEPPPMAKSEPSEPESSTYDDIPVLTDIIEETPDVHTPPGAPLSGGQLQELEDRLYRELEAHLVPQLSMAFGKALNELLGQAKIHIGVAVREHLVQELHNQTQRLEAKD